MGKKLAFATPTLALAAMRFCSASRRSGRRSSNCRWQIRQAPPAGRTARPRRLPRAIGPGLRPKSKFRSPPPGPQSVAGDRDHGGDVRRAPLVREQPRARKQRRLQTCAERCPEYPGNSSTVSLAISNCASSARNWKYPCATSESTRRRMSRRASSLRKYTAR